MRKTLFTVITDTAFFSFIGFVVCLFTLIKRLPIRLALTVSIFFSLLLGIFIFYFLKKKRRKTFIKNRDKIIAEKVCFNLSLQSKPTLINLFFSAYEKQNLSPRKNDGHLILKDKKVFIFFSPDGLKKHNIVTAFNQLEKDQTAVIYYYNANLEILSYAKNFTDVLLVDKYDTYKFLSDSGVNLPQEKLTKIPPKKIDLSKLFIKKHAKKHLVFGVGFYLVSFFSILKTYYLISGTIFLILSIFSFVFGKQTNIEP